MGMFDTLSISDTLPFTQEMKDLGLDCNNHNWQTKDLDCTMSLYYIQGGRLFEQMYKKSNWIDGNPDADNWRDKVGYMHRSEPYLEPKYHHGELYFYDFINDVQDKWDCWIEFKAVFTNGFVDKYQLVKFEKKDNTERKRIDREWAEQTFKENNKWINKYFFRTKPMRWFGQHIWYKGCMAISLFFNRIAFKL